MFITKKVGTQPVMSWLFSLIFGFISVCLLFATTFCDVTKGITRTKMASLMAFIIAATLLTRTHIRDAVLLDGCTNVLGSPYFQEI